MPANREAQQLATEIRLRQFDHQLSLISSTRAALTTLLGVETSLTLAIIALSFRDGRSPDSDAVIVGWIFLGAGLICGGFALFRSRDVVRPPVLSDEAKGVGSISAIDLQSNYATALDKTLTDNSKRIRYFDLFAALSIVLVLASAASWAFVLSDVEPPAPSVTTTTPAGP